MCMCSKYYGSHWWTIDAAFREAMQKLGLDSLKEKKIEAVRSFVSDQDTT